ncbi:hypothetical protein [Jannaschia sp. LMIT008]|uniref:hypothetical protein n=1 Tax=Jannaschia maritima TaxID=3032585 RepID=UPI0028127086|nr:hypothetical protein [Jannaschia sp. LMIT008]
MTFSSGIRIKMLVTVRATDADGQPLDMTRIWVTKNGRNRDIHRPHKGKGEYGNFGPYSFEYKPASSGLTKLKIQTGGDRPSIIFYTVKQIG